mmetsp:Transcript_25818/g.82010  ORF Transcript_25818/g.82010 Transcript_25818/m.82010 type:complete len:232 (+) Transcript_25818:2617-3312(+)
MPGSAPRSTPLGSMVDSQGGPPLPSEHGPCTWLRCSLRSSGNSEALFGGGAFFPFGGGGGFLGGGAFSTGAGGGPPFGTGKAPGDASACAAASCAGGAPLAAAGTGPAAVDTAVGDLGFRQAALGGGPATTGAAAAAATASPMPSTTPSSTSAWSQSRRSASSLAASRTVCESISTLKAKGGSEAKKPRLHSRTVAEAPRTSSSRVFAASTPRSPGFESKVCNLPSVVRRA